MSNFRKTIVLIYLLTVLGFCLYVPWRMTVIGCGVAMSNPMVYGFFWSKKLSMFGAIQFDVVILEILIITCFYGLIFLFANKIEGLGKNFSGRFTKEKTAAGL